MSPGTPPSGRSAGNLWVPVALFVLAVALALNPFPYANDVSESSVVPRWATDTTPVRQTRLRPEYTASVFNYRCSECHKIIASPAETSRTLTQHTEIQLDHGINTRCFNCHHRTNRDAFVDDYGLEIPWDQPQLLCRKCHGPVYRDWEHGSHGRTNGYWDKSQGTQTRRRCIECHDPHRPPFPALAPAPGPNTLRMGPQELGGHREGHDPLRLGGRVPAGGAVTVAEGKN